MLNKNDPLIAAVQKVMQTNQAEREAVALVNEKFGVADRRALPRERQHEWDSAYAKVLSEGVEALSEKVKMTKQQFANLDGKPEFTANDLAHARAGTHKKKAAAGKLEEAEKMKGDDPCWKGYEMIGMKKKGGKEVPNCVPVKEEGDPSKAIRGDVVTGGSSVTTVPKPTPKPTVGEPDQKALANKIKSVMEEWSKKQRNKQKEIADAIARENPGMSKSRKFAIAGGAVNKMKTVKEGFNNRHNSSVTASVNEQVVADQLNEQETYADYDPAKETRNKFAKLSGATSGRRVRNFLSQRKFLKANPPQGSYKAEPGNYRVNKAIDQAKAFASGAVGYGSDYEKFYPRAAETGKLAGIGSMLLPGRPVTAVGQAAAKAPAVATQTTNVANRFRANLANRRYNVSGAQQRPPQNVAQAAQPVSQGSVPSVAQGSGQANRLAAIRRPESGPWGNTPAASSKLRVAPGTAAARLQASRQAQNARVGGNTVAANQAAARTRLSQQTQQSRVGGNTVAANQAAARTSLAQRVQNMRAGAPMAGARRVPQTAFTNDTPNISAAPNTAKAAPAPSAGVTARKIEANPRKVSDTEIMNAPQYKQAVSDVGGPDAARRIKPGTDVAGVGRVEKGQTIWSKVKSQLEKQPVKGFEMGANRGGAGR